MNASLRTSLLWGFWAAVMTLQPAEAQVADTAQATQPFAVEIRITRSYTGVGWGLFAANSDSLERMFTVPADTNLLSGITDLPALRPGAYSLALRTLVDDHVAATRTVRFSVLPPLWAQGWFLALAATLLVGGVWGIQQYRAHVQRTHAQAMAAARRAERAHVRKQATRDFHDELGHAATRIAFLGEVLKQQHLPDHPALEQMIASARQLSQGMGDFIWTLDPEPDSLYDLLLRLKDFGDTLFEHAHIAFRAEGGWEALQTTRLSAPVRRHLLLLFKEAMHNAFRHAQPHNVTLALHREANQFTLTLSDDGVGFILTQTSKQRGLDHMQSRAAAIGAILHLDAKPQHGTTISVTFSPHL